PNRLSTAVVGTGIGEVALRRLDAERLTHLAARQDRRGTCPAGPVRTDMEQGDAIGASRGVMDHVDGAGEGGRAEVHRRRPAHHFNPLDVVQADGLELRNERTAGGNTVDEQQQVVDLADSEQPWHRRRWTRITAWRDADSADERQ